MKRVLLEMFSINAKRAVPVALVLVGLAPGCGPKLDKTAIEIGGGMRKGSPPMCYQYRGEARPLARGYDIWVHLNNSCSYSVDCTFFDDVTEQQNQFVMPAYQQQSVVLSRGSESKRVSIVAECVWKP